MICDYFNYKYSTFDSNLIKSKKFDLLYYLNCSETEANLENCERKIVDDENRFPYFLPKCSNFLKYKGKNDNKSEKYLNNFLKNFLKGCSNNDEIPYDTGCYSYIRHFSKISYSRSAIICSTKNSSIISLNNELENN